MRAEVVITRDAADGADAGSAMVRVLWEVPSSLGVRLMNFPAPRQLVLSNLHTLFILLKKTEIFFPIISISSMEYFSGGYSSDEDDLKISA